jgi:hypothetical protein
MDQAPARAATAWLVRLAITKGALIIAFVDFSFHA